MAKILIADDERPIQIVIRRLLNDNGFETVEASNGLAALEYFQTQFFDLIITDLRMPRMDGMTFLNEIRVLDPSTPIIILTAFSPNDPSADPLTRTAFACLSKPFKNEELLSAIKSALESRNQPASSPSPQASSGQMAS